jgi:hypothetical protein
MFSHKIWPKFSLASITIDHRTMSKSTMPSQYPPSLSSRRTYDSRERSENLINILEMAIKLFSETEDQTKSGASSKNGHGSFNGHDSFNGDAPSNGDDSSSSQR